MEEKVSTRFWSHVLPVGECLIWQSSLKPGGYGQFNVGGANVNAHRFAYLDIIGDIADGLVIDHICRNRSCVNPGHMEPVTRGENVLRGVGTSASNARKTLCPVGHEYTKYQNGKRRCRQCHTTWKRNRRRELAYGK